MRPEREPLSFSSRHAGFAVRFALGVGVVGFCFLLPMAQGAAFRWTGDGSANEWGEESNWNPSGVPTAADFVTIDERVEVDLGGEQEAATLELRGGASIVNSGTGGLTVGRGADWGGSGIVFLEGEGKLIQTEITFEGQKSGRAALFALEGGAGDVMEISGPVNIGTLDQEHACLVLQEQEHAAHIVFSDSISGSAGQSRLQIIPGKGTVTLTADNHFTAGNGLVEFPVVADGITSTLQLANQTALGDIENFLRVSHGAGRVEQDRVARVLISEPGVRIENHVTVGLGAITEIGGSNTSGAVVWAGEIILVRSPDPESALPVRLTAEEGGLVEIHGQVLDRAGGTSRPVEKIGPGTVVVSREGGLANQGMVKVREGMLLVANHSGSGVGGGPVMVEKGGVLGGTGRIVPDEEGQGVTVRDGGILLAGAGEYAEGILRIDGGLTFEPGGIFRVVLGPAGMVSALNRASRSHLWTFAGEQLVEVVLEDGAIPGKYPGIITGLSKNPGVESWRVLTPGFERSHFAYEASGEVTLVLVR